MYYSAEDVQTLKEGYDRVTTSHSRLYEQIFDKKFTNSRAREFAHHGLLRRLNTVKRCIENIYSICPINCPSISTERLLDLSIQLQAHLFNLYGSFDNIAWIWINERQLEVSIGRTLRRNEISLQSAAIKNSFTADFRNYLDEMEQWFEYLQNYRHALAHRIPLYVPPSVLNSAVQDRYNELETLKSEAITHRDYDLYFSLDHEQDSLGKFYPVMTHSYSENSRPVRFHGQILSDWNTLEAVIERFLTELKHL